MCYKPKFAGEIMVDRRQKINITNTKIDDMALGINLGLPKFTNEEKLKHYNEKLNLVWEGKICFE